MLEVELSLKRQEGREEKRQLQVLQHLMTVEWWVQQPAEKAGSEEGGA